MTTQEHLNAIVAKCKSLLELAEGRTQGGWVRSGYDIKQPHGRQIADVGPHHTPPYEYPTACRMADERNGDFIAACAGSAEAGWRATIAAIEGLLSLASVPQVEAPYEMHQAWEQDAREAKTHLNAILAAWPEELLK